MSWLLSRKRSMDDVSAQRPQKSSPLQGSCNRSLTKLLCTGGVTFEHSFLPYFELPHR
jgi:hypothetical protein